MVGNTITSLNLRNNRLTSLNGTYCSIFHLSFSVASSTLSTPLTHSSVSIHSSVSVASSTPSTPLIHLWRHCITVWYHKITIISLTLRLPVFVIKTQSIRVFFYICLVARRSIDRPIGWCQDRSVNLFLPVVWKSWLWLVFSKWPLLLRCAVTVASISLSWCIWCSWKDRSARKKQEFVKISILAVVCRHVGIAYFGWSLGSEILMA